MMLLGIAHVVLYSSLVVHVISTWHDIHIHTCMK